MTLGNFTFTLTHDASGAKPAGNIPYASLAALIGSVEPPRGTGAIWQASTYLYLEAEPCATDADVTTAGGAKLYVQASGTGEVVPDQFVVNAEPGTTDMSAAIEAADQLADSGAGVVVFLSQIYRMQKSVAKSARTVWRGPGMNRSSGGLGAEILTYHDDVALVISGDGVNRRGRIDGIRIRNGDPVAYPAADGVKFTDDARDQIIADCYIGDFRTNIEVDGGKAIYLDRVYSYGATHNGCWVHNGSTDCSFTGQSQFSGGEYGLFLDGTDGALAGMQVDDCRPQSSGLANFRAEGVTFLTVNGGFNDTAINGGGGRGIEIVNCVNWSVCGVIFYSNGDDKSHIFVDALLAGVCTDGAILGCRTVQAAANTGTVIGVEFGTCAGVCRKITIGANDLSAVDQSIVFNTVTGELDSVTLDVGNILKEGAAIINADQVANRFRIRDMEGLDSYATSASPAADIVLKADSASIQRFSGAIAADINIDLPISGNWKGKTIRIIRKDGGTGIVTVRHSAATAVHQMTGAHQWVELVAIGTGATWVELAADDLSR